MTYYVPGLGEKDTDKTIRSLMQVHEKTATNTTDIAALQADAADYVVGPASATANGFAVYDGTTGKLVKNHAATIALGSEVSGTLPVANGGTGDTGTAWTAWAPTVTAGSGTFTTLGTVTARYKQLGKTVFFYISIPITTNGTAAGFVQATLPFTAANFAYQMVIGRENAAVGFSCAGRIPQNTSTVQITKYDATYPGADGYQVDVAGQYETT
jgi:hypothetical protein